MSEKISFNKPYIIGKELYYIAQSVQNGHLSGDGKFTKLCNKWLEDKFDAKKILLTHSCTAALEMAAILCDIQPGDEFIVPSYTFVSTVNAFVLRGGVPTSMYQVTSKWKSRRAKASSLLPVSMK